jgi:coenzyme F420-dependent glucose-6-phosphate dehydrogenase
MANAMGMIESVKAIRWARKRQPDEVAYLAALASERFAPEDLVRQAIAAEEAGFDGICTSDHINPWWVPGDLAPAACGNPWVWLGAAGQATREVSLGTAVTGLVGRYNPVVVAQQVATLERLFPGRAFLGVGTSEAMNEIPAGIEWPSVSEQLERIEEALTIITRLLDGEMVDFQGRHFRARRARLWALPERRPPVYMSAFGERAGEIAGRLADGVWTLADPMQGTAVIAAYRRGADEAGREPGEIILQALASWAEDDDTALAASREWKGTLIGEHYTDPIFDPAEIQANGEEVSDTKFKAMGIVSSDPASHARKLKAMREMGATVIAVMNVSGADPMGWYRVYGEEILPELRG